MPSKPVPETPKASGWTVEQRLQLAIQILATNPGPYNMKKINMPGRTPKAITHQWGRFRAEMQAFTDGEGSAEKPKSAGKKRGPDTDDSGTPIAKKRATAKTATPVKQPEVAEGEGDPESDGSMC